MPLKITEKQMNQLQQHMIHVFSLIVIGSFNYRGKISRILTYDIRDFLALLIKKGINNKEK